MNRIPDIRTQASQLIAAASISSTNPDLDMGNRGCAETLATWLTDLGFACELMELPGQPHKVNLIATLGSGPGGLVLAGHIDTVPCDETAWASDPFRLSEQDERWHGLGICDMKGFFAIVLQAIHDMDLSALSAPLIVLATADEESSMHGARALAAAGRPKARYAVIGEPTGLRPVRMHKGILMEALEIQGQAAHASRPDLGHSAIDDMHRAMTALIQLREEWQTGTLRHEFAVPHATLNIGSLQGGDAPNRIAACCSASLDVRLLPGQSPEEMRSLMHRRVEAAVSDPGRLSWQHLFEGLCAFETAADTPLVQVAERLTGHASAAVDFATEAPFLSGMGMQTIVLGPGDIDQAHQPDEFLDSGRIAPMIGVVQGLIKQFCIE